MLQTLGIQAEGPVEQWITRLTMDQKIVGIQAKCFVCIFLLNLHNNDLKVQGLIILMERWMVLGLKLLDLA